MISAPEEIALLRAGALPSTCRDRARTLSARLSGSSGPWSEPTPERHRLEEDLRTGAVVPVDCTVDWERAGALCVYRAQAVPQVVLHATVYLPPLPGRWRLYVLRASGLAVGGEAWVASATAPGAPSRDQVAAYRHALLSAQGHTPADLTALGQGHLPPSAARWARAGRATRGLLAGIAWAAAAMAGVVAILRPDVCVVWVGQRLPVFWLASLGAAVVALGLTTRLLAAPRRPSALHGTAVAAPSSGGPGATWWIDVDGVVFRSHSGHPVADLVGPLLVPGLRVIAFQALGTLVAIDLDPGLLG